MRDRERERETERKEIGHTSANRRGRSLAPSAPLWPSMKHPMPCKDKQINEMIKY